MVTGTAKTKSRIDALQLKYVRTETPISLIDYHFVVPLPRAVVPSRIVQWCRENCDFGWLMQLPRMGMPSWRNTVILFESEDDMARFRDRYCFDARYNQRSHDRDWMDAVSDDE